jgi:hypothetical protein
MSPFVQPAKPTVNAAAQTAAANARTPVDAGRNACCSHCVDTFWMFIFAVALIDLR